MRAIPGRGGGRGFGQGSWQQGAVLLAHSLLGNLTLRQLQKEEQHEQKPGKEAKHLLPPQPDFSPVVVGFKKLARGQEEKEHQQWTQVPIKGAAHRQRAG